MLKSVLLVNLVFVQSSKRDEYIDHGEGELCLLQLRGLDEDHQSAGQAFGLGLSQDELPAEPLQKLHARTRESKADVTGSCSDSDVECSQCATKAECELKAGCIYCPNGNICRNKYPPPMIESRMCMGD